ncbi:MAG: TolC family protein, partial [Planctomycetota bacterium]
RDASGNPMVPNDQWLPELPEIQTPPIQSLDESFIAAINRRPEPQLLDLMRRDVRLERRLARNNLLPTLDFIAEASQDIGEDSSSSGDKDRFKLFFGIQSDVPIQRRKSRGKIQSTTAKIAQFEWEQRLLYDQIRQQLQTSQNRLRLTGQTVEQSRQALAAAEKSLAAYEKGYTSGADKVNLISLNLVEVKTFEIRIKLIMAQIDFYIALAQLQRELGLDPLAQAMQLADPSSAVDAQP